MFLFHILFTILLTIELFIHFIPIIKFGTSLGLSLMPSMPSLRRWLLSTTTVVPLDLPSLVILGSVDNCMLPSCSSGWSQYCRLAARLQLFSSLNDIRMWQWCCQRNILLSSSLLFTVPSMLLRGLFDWLIPSSFTCICWNSTLDLEGTFSQEWVQVCWNSPVHLSKNGWFLQFWYWQRNLLRISSSSSSKESPSRKTF